MAVPSHPRLSYAAYLKTEHFRMLEQEVFHLRGRICAACKAEEDIQARHVIFRSYWDCIPDDLLPLCPKCLVWFISLRRGQHHPQGFSNHDLERFGGAERSAYLRQIWLRCRGNPPPAGHITLNCIRLDPKQRSHFRTWSYADYQKNL